MARVEKRDGMVMLYTSKYHAEPLTPEEALTLARSLTGAADALLQQSATPSKCGMAWEGSACVRYANHTGRHKTEHGEVSVLHEPEPGVSDFSGDGLDEPPPRYLLEVFSGKRSIYREYFAATDSSTAQNAVSKTWPRHASVSQVVVRPLHHDEVEVPPEGERDQSDPTFTGGGSMEGAMPWETPAEWHEREHPRSEGRRPDWDSLTPDQKVRARLEGTEYREPTLEERVQALEKRLAAVERRPSPYDVIG